MPPKKVKSLSESLTSIFKKEEPQVIREDITAEMRKNAQIIIGILSATDIERSKLSDEVKNAGLEDDACDEEINRIAMIEDLQNAPAISDDMRRIDTYLINFAQCYKEAAENGQNTTFHWAGNAIARGIGLRKNLPHEDPATRAKHYDGRLKQMEQLNRLITACKAVDDAMFKHEQSAAMCTKAANEFNQIRHEISQYIATPAGGAAQKELDENGRQQNGVWSDAARDLNAKYNDLVRAKQSAEESAWWLSEHKEKLSSSNAILQKCRESLLNNESAYDEQLARELEVLMSDNLHQLEKIMDRNEHVQKVLENFHLSMEVIVQDSDIAKKREYRREKIRDEMIEMELRDQNAQEVEESPYAYLKQKEPIKHKQRATNSMD